MKVSINNSVKNACHHRSHYEMGCYPVPGCGDCNGTYAVCGKLSLQRVSYDLPQGNFKKPQQE
jgi:hypothetical protein